MAGPKSENPEAPTSSSLASLSLPSYDELELSAWMRLAQGGDAEAYQNLLRRAKKLLDSFVRNALNRDARWAVGAADDIVQDTLLGIHAKRHTYDPSKPFLPWFYAIARYKVIDSLRAGSKHRRNIELDEELANTLPDSLPEAESLFAGIDAETLLRELPEKQRTVLELVKLQGLSMREASERSGYSVSDIKVTAHRAIKSLQKKLRPLADE